MMMNLIQEDFSEEYLEYYVKKYLEDYEDSTSDTSDSSDSSIIDWDFQKKGISVEISSFKLDPCNFDIFVFTFFETFFMISFYFKPRAYFSTKTKNFNHY